MTPASVDQISDSSLKDDAFSPNAQSSLGKMMLGPTPPALLDQPEAEAVKTQLGLWHGRRNCQDLPPFPSSAELKWSIHVEITGRGGKLGSYCGPSGLFHSFPTPTSLDDPGFPALLAISCWQAHRQEDERLLASK